MQEAAPRKGPQRYQPAGAAWTSPEIPPVHPQSRQISLSRRSCFERHVRQHCAAAAGITFPMARICIVAEVTFDLTVPAAIPRSPDDAWRLRPRITPTFFGVAPSRLVLTIEPAFRVRARRSAEVQ